jgi:hypothetical protein
VPDVAIARARLEADGISAISPGVVAPAETGEPRGLLVRDPDGHVIELIEP